MNSWQDCFWAIKSEEISSPDCSYLKLSGLFGMGYQAQQHLWFPMLRSYDYLFGSLQLTSLQMVIDANNIIRNAIEKGSKIDLLMEQWDFLQSQCACFINSDLPGLPSQLHQAPGKPVK